MGPACGGGVVEAGTPGAGACTDLAKDPSERFVTTLGGSVQDFREDFAVRPAIGCNKPCRATLTGSVRIAGRGRSLKLDTSRIEIEYPGQAPVNVVAGERGTDTILAALRRDRRVAARVTFRAVDGTGRAATRTRTYRLR